jgi:hypothetical protein
MEEIANISKCKGVAPINFALIHCNSDATIHGVSENSGSYRF